MFSDDILDLLIEKKIQLSEDLIDYLINNQERLDNFELQLRKSLNSKIQTNVMLIGVYEREAKKAKGQLNSTTEIEKNKQQEEYKSHLNPIRYPTKDFFIADVHLDHIRDDIASMEYPIFALKAGDENEINFEINGAKTSIKSLKRLGRATIFDKDIWIYCISKLMQAKYEGKEIKRTVTFNIYDFLVSTNRKKIGGSQYEMFRNSLERLRGTTVTTEVITGGKRDTKIFGLLEMAHIEEEKDVNGKRRIIAIHVELPDWLYRSVLSNEVLKISPDYFRLKKPIDRRIYEIVRKHIGSKKDWSISLGKLYEKTGSTTSIGKFRFNVKSLSSRNELPDYLVKFNRMNDIVTFINRGKVYNHLHK